MSFITDWASWQWSSYHIRFSKFESILLSCLGSSQVSAMGLLPYTSKTLLGLCTVLFMLTSRKWGWTLDAHLQRAEHNDGLLSTLEEITLHGQNIEEIEVIGHACRNLKILYLQNNVIAKIQDIHHLKVNSAYKSDHIWPPENFPDIAWNCLCNQCSSLHSCLPSSECFKQQICNSTKIHLEQMLPTFGYLPKSVFQMSLFLSSGIAECI